MVVAALTHCGGDPAEGGESGGTGGSAAGTTTSGAGPTTEGEASSGEAPTEGGMSASQSTTLLPTATSDESTGGASASTDTGDDTTASTGADATSVGSTTSDDSSTGEAPPVCGDGVVGGDEECDDGNADDSDTCVAGCKQAQCGDGFVGPGEGCDDGNAVDDDACANDCSLASCGDGKLQQGEVCDDGDADDTDACLSTCVAASCGDGAVQAGVEACDDGNAADDDACVDACVPASCGDGFVQAGVEACDDGNAANDDACTELCLAPACDDGLQSGDESDVDCGGGCGGCGLGEGCEAAGDCDSDTCDGGICVLAASCKAIKAADPGAADGLYDVDPDGGGPGPAFPVYCDMTTDGGGWALAIRFAPMNGQFHFYSPHWTMVSLVNAGVTDPADPSDGKFPAYNGLPGAEIRGCMRHPMTLAYACKAYALPGSTTLLDLFTNTPVGSADTMKGLYFNEPQPDKLQWLTIQGRTVAEASTPPNYVGVGINVDDDLSCYDARVRFGLALNNEANINTLNDTAGFGAQAYYTSGCDLAPGVDSPWRTGCGFQAGATSYHTAGHIWIR